MNTIKNIFNNRFTWNVMMAITSILLAGCYIFENETFLAVCWILIAVCNIGEACINAGTRGQ